MEILCTRPDCPSPRNFFDDLNDPSKLKIVQQRHCTGCGMPLILVNRYIVVRLLGKGGFGSAFLARDRYTPTMRWCVVKQFQPADNLPAEELAMAQTLFEREAVVLEQLGNKHQQIPQLYAFFPLIVPSQDGIKEEQFFYLVQEFIDGQDLEAELATKGKFAESEVRQVLVEVLKILHFVHQNGSIHRDIKPSNIMRSCEGTFYLLDFGAVKQVTTQTRNSNTDQSTGIYSLGFAPPEQMAGAKVYSSTDLYALAATCINLLTAKPAKELYDSYNHRWDWKKHAPGISEVLMSVLDRMLLATPSERFQSAAEVLNTLNATTYIPYTVSSDNSLLKSAKLPKSSSQMYSTHNSRSRIGKKFSLAEIITSAAFTGFEGALLCLAFINSLSFSGIGLGLWGMIVGGLIYAQVRRWIKKFDFAIIAGITFAIILLLPILRGNLDIIDILVIAIMSAAAAIAATAIFRLIYQLLSRILYY